MVMESFHVCFSAAQRWLGTVAEQGSAWSASIYIYIERERQMGCRGKTTYCSKKNPSCVHSNRHSKSISISLKYSSPDARQ